MLKDETVVTWDSMKNDVDSRSVNRALIGVDTIYSTSFAFAAVLKDTTVVTWGDEDCGGDSTSVKTA